MAAAQAQAQAPARSAHGTCCFYLDFLLPSAEPKRRQCKVLFEYSPVNEDELELKVGEIVDILEEVLQTCLLWDVWLLFWHFR